MSDGGYRLPDNINEQSRAYVCIGVPDDPGHRQAFAGALYALTRWFSWERDDSKSGAAAAAVWMPIWLDAMQQLDAKYQSCGGEQDQITTTDDIGLMGAPGCIDDSEDDMPNVFIIKLDGKPYLAQNCGCETELYRLDQATVTTDEEGKAVVSSMLDDDVKAGKDLTFDIPTGYLSCYATKAVAYLMDRFIEYFIMSNNILEEGIDTLAGGLDELYDIGAIVIDLLGGSTTGLVDDLRGWSVGDVQAVLADPDYIDALEAVWTATGALNRWELQDWIAKTPAHWDDVPMQVLLRTWVRYSVMAGYNTALRVLAAECENEKTLEDVILEAGGQIELPDGTLYSETEYNNYLYPVWYQEPGVVLDGSGGNIYWYAPDAYKEDIFGMFFQIQASGEGGCEIYFQDGHVQLTPLNGTAYKGGSEDANMVAMIESYTSLDFHTGGGGGDDGLDPHIRTWNVSGTNTYTIQKVWMVGAGVAT